MSHEVTALSKRLATAFKVADKRSLARVSALVGGEVAALSKRFAATRNVTDERSLARVSALVFD